MADKYSNMGELASFGFLINGMGGGGDVGASFPRSDAEDLSCGARFIPGEVTMARRRGERVQFVTRCTRNCWYWEMQDGTRHYHWDPIVAAQLGLNREESNAAGPCPTCGNTHTNGGAVARSGSEARND